MEESIKIRFRLDLVLVYSICAILSVMFLNYWLRGAVAIFPLFVMWVLLIGANGNNRNRLILALHQNSSSLFLLVAFILVNIFHFLFSYSSVKASNFTVVFIYYLIFYVFRIYYSQKEILSIFFVMTLILGIQAIVSIPNLIDSNVFVSRLLASGELSLEDSIEAYKKGIGTNGLYTSNVLLVILSFSFYKFFGGIKKIVLLLSVIAITISIFISTYFASISMLLLGGILSVLFRLKTILSLKKILLFGLILITIGFLYSYLKQSTRLMDPIISKLDRFGSGESDVTGRESLTKASINTFNDNIFFGIGVPDWQSYSKVGEHMIWVDILAHFGIIGVLPFFVFLFINLRKLFVIRNDPFSMSAAVVFVVSSFISPMLIVPNTLMILVLFIFPFNEKNSIYS